MHSDTTTGVTWVLEAEVFSQSHTAMREAVLAEGHSVVRWRDDWLETGHWPLLADQSVVFHGSLGNAATITSRLPWRPGTFCNVNAFRCSSWYSRARRWLVHDNWQILPANQLVANSEAVFARLGASESVFVRPDSPLKPFSGRVLQRHGITLRAMDHGFYYDEETLPVVVAPTRKIGREWRYVVVRGLVVAGSAYEAATRAARPDTSDGSPWQFARAIAETLEAPEDTYVLDICETDGDLRLLELNPFSGADLYACDRGRVVAAVSALAKLLLAQEGGGQRAAAVADRGGS